MAGSQAVSYPDKNSGLIINEATNQVNDSTAHLSDRIKSKRKRGRRKNKSVISLPIEQKEDIDCSQGNTLYLNTVANVSTDLAPNSCLSIANIEKINCNSEKFLKMENIKISDESNKSDKITQRLERKQAKLASKKKSKNKSDETKKKIDISQQIIVEEKSKAVNQPTKLLDKTMINQEESSEGNTLSTIRTEEIVLKVEIDSSEDKTVPVNKPKVGYKITNQVTDITKQTEKSREEIKAEREARKKAKLNTKLKGKAFQEVNRSECDVNDNSTAIKESNKSQELVLGKNESIDVGLTVKSKAELKAERRAKQEAQRAAKEGEKRTKLQMENKVVNFPSIKKTEISVENNKPNRKKMISVTPKVGLHRVELFSHLKFEQKSCKASLINDFSSIHPQVVQLAIKYSSRIIMGSNARCIALLKVLKEVIMDYVIPSEKEFSRALESYLSTLMGYLNKFRPSSVSMTNAVRHIKSHLTQLSNDITDVEARRKLCDVIDTYIREQIDVAGEAICNTVQNKIANGDNILIYACSSLLYRILVESHKSGKQFTVVVVDSGPWFEGREMLRRLIDHGIRCSYVLVSALTFIMRGVSKVLLGAHALLANGSVMSRTGSALVALVANSYNVPVLVCCETYKFCERVQMDAFVYNELGNDEDMEYSRCKDIKENESAIATLSVLYDITPADLVTAVVTELAILPCTSVPVILRIKPSDVVT